MAKKPKIPRPPKGTRVDSKGRTSSDRLKSVRRRRFRRRFGEDLLESFGLGGADFSEGGFIKGKLGLFSGPISGKSRKDRAGAVGGLPALTTPTRESKKTNPTLSTILDQLDQLIKSANKLGVVSKAQQKALLKKIEDARKLDRESLIETKDDAALQNAGGVSPEALQPLVQSMTDLLKKLGALNSTLDDKIDESEEDRGTFASRFFEDLGFGDEYESYDRRKRARLERMQSPENQKRQRITERERRASRFSPDQLKSKSGKPLSGRVLDQRLDKLEAVKKPSLLSRATTNISSFIGSRAARSSIVAKGVTNVTALRSTLKRVAGPLIAKTLGRTTLKSIPIIGAFAGAGFALNRLIQGDSVGAGLELMSGLGSVFTAIPAMVASIVRDSYASIYGIQPEQDPDAPKRLVELKTATEDLIKETMEPQVETRARPTSDQIDRALLPENRPQTTRQETAEPVGRPPVIPPPINPTVRTNGQAAASPGIPPSTSTTPISTSGTASQSSEAQPAAAVSEPQTNLIPSDPKGRELIDHTLQVQNLEDRLDKPMVIPLDRGPPLPATTATTRPNAAGMGDVRSPYYPVSEMGTIPDQVYY